MEAIARELGDVKPIVVRPVLNTHLDWGRQRFILTYQKQ